MKNYAKFWCMVAAYYGKEIDDMVRRVPSLERIRRQVGYEPKVNLERTLEIIISYFRETVE